MTEQLKNIKVSSYLIYKQPLNAITFVGGKKLRIQNLFLSIAIALMVAVTTFAQTVSGETESGVDTTKEGFFSQYVFFDTKNVNALVRYFWVRNAVNRGEFAIGPTFKVKEKTVVKLSFGATTSREVMAYGVLTTNIDGHDFLYNPDMKFSTREEIPNTFYHKGTLSLNKNKTVHARAEHLMVGKSNNFLRLGVEFQHNMPEKTQIYAAPFYDPLRNAVGIQGGFRFF